MAFFCFGLVFFEIYPRNACHIGDVYGWFQSNKKTEHGFKIHCRYTKIRTPTCLSFGNGHWKQHKLYTPPMKFNIAPEKGTILRRNARLSAAPFVEGWFFRPRKSQAKWRKLNQRPGRLEGDMRLAEGKREKNTPSWLKMTWKILNNWHGCMGCMFQLHS